MKVMGIVGGDLVSNVADHSAGRKLPPPPHIGLRETRGLGCEGVEFEAMQCKGATRQLPSDSNEYRGLKRLRALYDLQVGKLRCRCILRRGKFAP